jgi:hypothetical protein
VPDVAHPAEHDEDADESEERHREDGDNHAVHEELELERLE